MSCGLRLRWHHQAQQFTMTTMRSLFLDRDEGHGNRAKFLFVSLCADKTPLLASITSVF